MTTGEPGRLVARTRLSAAEAAAVHALARVCNAAEGLDLKLSVGDLGIDDAWGPRRFLYYVGDALAGFCSLDGGMEIEICGMVDPAQRRRGIGRALLAAARAACDRRGVVALLAICEEASASGRAFVAALGGRFDFAEHHMERDLPAALPAADPPAPSSPDGAAGLDIRPAGPADLDVLARVIAGAFGDPVDVVRQRIVEDLVPGGDLYFLALHGPVPVGGLKIVDQGDRAGIYAFGVLPEYRGRGFGRQILAQMLARLHAEGRTRAALEVETTNAPAIALYLRCGFQITTTYGYYRLPLSSGG